MPWQDIFAQTDCKNLVGCMMAHVEEVWLPIKITKMENRITQNVLVYEACLTT